MRIVRGAAAAAVVVLLAGCSSDDEPDAEQSPDETPAAAEETPELTFADRARELPGGSLSGDDQAVEDLAGQVCDRYESLPPEQADTMMLGQLTDLGAFEDEQSARGFVELAIGEFCPDVAAS
ncbi:hypothetical protein CLV30_12828 [Haloactinopolyspora alba]|uniref:DUF732 domain-containing protein n=1 Tax=Haloactinopolyspora alba TaxID=648780 RepID=A0A2P8DEX2_9ACTN|nr:hypothetical protein [Haloactinopolyspora alba]PSK95776.1 hypothetical protein CLV30_12828 [Haloactinopolyspora alba]